MCLTHPPDKSYVSVQQETMVSEIRNERIGHHTETLRVANTSGMRIGNYYYLSHGAGARNGGHLS